MTASCGAADKGGAHDASWARNTNYVPVSISGFCIQASGAHCPWTCTWDGPHRMRALSLVAPGSRC